MTASDTAPANPLDLPSHALLTDTLLALGAVQDPAEFHGFIAAHHALGQPIAEQALVNEFVDFMDCDAPCCERAEQLKALDAATAAQLRAEEFSFELLLPDDERPFVDRVLALGGWCQGFLHGFAAAGKRRKDRGAGDFSKEASELVNDLVAISQIGLEDDAETSESDLLQVTEFVRVAVLTLYAECHPAAPQAPSSATLH